MGAVASIREAAEEWRAIPGYEGVYSVSDQGRVRRDLARTNTKAGRILRAALRNGYPFVDLSVNGKTRAWSVHQLVALAFLGPPPPGKAVNHVNADREDPRLVNLEYATQSENVLHAYRLGLRCCKGEGNGQAKLTREQVISIRRKALWKRGEITATARRLGVNPSTVRGVITRRIWPHVE